MSSAASSFSDHIGINNGKTIRDKPRITMSHILNFKDAVKSGDLDRVKTMIRPILAASPTYDHELETAFYEAASRNHVKIMKYLINEHGVSPLTNHGWVVVIAAAHDAMESIRFLCEELRPVHIIPYIGILRAYKWARSGKNREIMEYLSQFLEEEDKLN
jgi:hypothetical protein